jgi:hypothetical protein
MMNWKGYKRVMSYFKVAFRHSLEGLSKTTKSNVEKRKMSSPYRETNLDSPAAQPVSCRYIH